MEYSKFRIDYQSRTDIFKLYPLGDIHGANVYCAEKPLREKVRQIKEDPTALWVGMGDYTECITPDDIKRWDVSGMADWVEKANIIESQRKWIVDVLKPISVKCVGMLEGNHECDIRKKHHNDIYMNVCKDLGVTPLGYSCFLDLLFNRQRGSVTRFRGRLTHGAGCPQTDGARLNRLKKGLKDYDADFYAHAHVHAITIDPGTPILAVDETGKIYHRNRCAAMTGCWFKTFEQGVRPSYGEIRDFSPTPIGCPVFLFKPDHHALGVIGGEL